MVRSGLLGIAVTLATPVAAQSVALQPGESLLEVQAEGQAKFLPDAAFLNIGVVSTGLTAKEATDANARLMTAVLAAVKARGVPGRQVRTQQINVEPRFARTGPQDYEGQPRITGYVARNGAAVTVTNVAGASEIIAGAFAAGANSVSGPNLGTLDPARGMAEARIDAIAQARAEADTYAKGLGMRVSRVLRVSERGSHVRQVDRMTADDIGSFSLAVARSPAPPVVAGEMRRTATVWIDYALVPVN